MVAGGGVPPQCKTPAGTGPRPPLASGVGPGMRRSEAIGLCRGAVVLPPDGPYYRRRFEEVLDVLERFSPDVEPGDTGTAYLSLRGLAVAPGAFGERLIAVLHGRTG